MRTFTKAEYVLSMAEEILDQRAAYEELKTGHKVALGAAALAGAGAVGHHIGYGAGHAAGSHGGVGHFLAGMLTGGLGTEAARKAHTWVQNNAPIFHGLRQLANDYIPGMKK